MSKLNYENSFIEVFAGCGGLSTGLIKAGFNPILLVDNDTNCVKTLKLNHSTSEYTKILKEDVTKLDLTEYKNKVHILAGGIPCQSWSLAGKRKGLDDKRGNLFFDFIKLIKECIPDIFLIENVYGLLIHNRGETFNYLIDLLSIDNQYEIKYQLLNSNDYDVPQKRKRIFIIGLKKDLNCKYSFPKSCKNKPTIKDAFYNIPKDFEYTQCSKYSDKKIEFFKKIPSGGCWIDLDEKDQKDYLGNSYNSGGGKRGILRRLSFDEPSLTLLTSPSQKQTERCHPSEIRPFNIREYARIQTFPDEYKFYGSITSKYKQIGNAVPVNLAYHIGLSISNMKMTWKL
jgi:DNA (cytosine-5)-methyltransferase 1